MLPARRWRIAAACALAGALASIPVGPATASVSGDRGDPAAPLRWRSCGGGECAKLRVPLDYTQPDGKQIKVALYRVRAEDDDRRIGSVLVNPGGPGASGVEFVRQGAFLFPQSLRDRFDLVGFDPRGVGGTIPVTCATDLDRHFAIDLAPDDAEDRSDLAAGMQQLARECERRSGGRLPHISSQDTVRDMDRIRAAVGDDQLTYLGFSYGSYLGALYADLFPDRVRALVLDGAVDPQLGKLERNVQQASGFEHSLDAFFEWCSAERHDCEFRNDGDPAGAFDELAADLDADPVRVGERRLGPGEFDLGVVAALYAGELGYQTLAEALAAAADGDGEPLLAQADDYTGRDEDGSYSNSQDAFWSIGCLDGPRLGGPEAYEAAAATVNAAAPRLGASTLNYDMVCAYWPVPAVPDPNPLEAAGAAPILVVGTTGDPATPIQWAEALAGQLESGVLLEVEGTSHTSYLSTSACVDRVVTRYLIRLTTPRTATPCAAE